jgi:hypothetical protein
MKKTALLPILLVCVLIIVQRVYQDSFEHLSSTDFGTYFEIIRNPEFFQFTLEEAYSAFITSPTSFLAVARWVSDLGFDYQNDSHCAIFAGVVTSIEVVVFVAANYLVLTSAGVSRALALLMILVITRSTSFSYFGRFFPIRALYSSPYLSLFSNVCSVLAVALFIRGKDRLSLLWAGLVTNLHAVVGPLSALFILSSKFFTLLYERKNPLRSKRLWGAVGIYLSFSSVFIFKLLNNPGGMKAEFIKNQFVQFALHRSANSFPLADGLGEVTCAFCYLVGSMFLSGGLDRNAASNRIIQLNFFLVATYVAQIVGADVLHMPLVMALGFHRFSPLYPLLFLWLTAMHIHLAFQRRDAVSFVCLLCVLLMNVLPGVRFFSAQFINFERVFWPVLIVSFISMWGHFKLGRQLSVLVFVVLFLSVALVSNVLTIWFSEPANYRVWPDARWVRELLFSNTGFGEAANIKWLFFVALLVSGAFFARRYGFNNLKPSRIVSTAVWKRTPSALFLSAFLASFYWGQTYRAGKHLSQIPRMEKRPNQDLVNFVTEHTEPRDGLFVVFQTEMAGVRRQFLDWKAAWLTLYAKQSFPLLWQKITALDMDIGPDSVAHSNCQMPYRLFIARCMLTRGQQLDPLYNSKRWVSKIAAMRSADPNLNHVLLRTNDDIPCHKIPCNVVATSDRFILLKLH